MIETTNLNMIVKERLYITLFLISGFQLKGHIVSFDNDTVLVESQGTNKLIYKHAISTIEF